MMKRLLIAAQALCLPLVPVTAAAQQTPPGALDDAWVNACAQAQPGTDFFDRCQEIINAGPGSGDRRSAAAVGNNLGTTGAQGRAANRIDETREDEFEGIDYEEDFGRFSVHLNANYRNTERDETAFESGFESDLYGLNGGFDYRLNDAWSVGAVVGYQDSETDFAFDAGTMDTSAWSLTGVLDGQLGANGYFNAYAGVAGLDYDSRRNINYTIVLNAGQPDEETRTVSAVATSETDGDQFLAGASAGYGANRGALNLGFSAAVDLLETDIDGYTERGGNGLALTVEDQDIRSLTASVGANVSYTSSQGWGVLTPYVRLRFEHEFEDDSRTQLARFAADPGGFGITFDTEDPDRDYAVAAVGLTGVMLSGNAWYAEAQRLFLHDFFSEWALNAGYRFEF